MNHGCASLQKLQFFQGPKCFVKSCIIRKFRESRPPSQNFASSETRPSSVWWTAELAVGLQCNSSRNPVCPGLGSNTGYEQAASQILSSFLTVHAEPTGLAFFCYFGTFFFQAPDSEASSSSSSSLHSVRETNQKNIIDLSLDLPSCFVLCRRKHLREIKSFFNCFWNRAFSNLMFPYLSSPYRWSYRKATINSEYD